jgi:hypothetical protein
MKRFTALFLIVATSLNAGAVNAQTVDDAVSLLKAALNCDTVVDRKENGAKKTYLKTLKSNYIGDSETFALSVALHEYLLNRKAMSNVHWISDKVAFRSIENAATLGLSVSISCVAGDKCVHIETRTTYGRSFVRKIDCPASQFCLADFKSGDAAEDAAAATFQVCSPDAAQDAVDAINYLVNPAKAGDGG